MKHPPPCTPRLGSAYKVLKVPPIFPWPPPHKYRNTPMAISWQKMVLFSFCKKLWTAGNVLYNRKVMFPPRGRLLSLQPVILVTLKPNSSLQELHVYFTINASANNNDIKYQGCLKLKCWWQVCRAHEDCVAACTRRGV